MFTAQGSSSIIRLGVKIYNETEDSYSLTEVPLDIPPASDRDIDIEFSKVSNSQLDLKIFCNRALAGGERVHDVFVDESGDVEVIVSDSDLPVSISDILVQVIFR